ncbi:helix-turn-helix domain-containing protein [Vallitalea sediminicola]
MYEYKEMQGVIDYIEEHLDEDMCIDMLAEMGMLSKFYFQRLFYKLVGVTVMEYVRLRRVARASEDINNGGKITDIAFGNGFNSLETFTRAFKSVYSMTPSEYKKKEIPLAHFYKPDISLKYRAVDIGVPLIASGVVIEFGVKEIEKDIKVMGIMEECEIGVAGPDNPGVAWNKYVEMKNKINNQSIMNVEYGISFPSDKQGKFNYLASVQVDEFDNTNDKLYKYVVPKGLYVVCTFSAENFFELTNAALDKAMAYLLQTWLPNSDYDMIGDFAVEYYDYRCLKDHPIPQQVQSAPIDIIKNPPEMDIMVLVKRK